MSLQAAFEDANEAEGAFKIRDDPRVTRVGRVLCRLSIDEIPQIVNVLKGEMSLVGPRPLPLRDYALLEDWHAPATRCSRA
jgi:lipopolysaccharide/colanic/teichoic acid biosynthesis glycosyltransferase